MLIITNISIWLYRKRKLSNIGFEDNPIRGHVKLAHKGA